MAIGMNSIYKLQHDTRMSKYEIAMLLQVHDSLVIRTRKDVPEKVINMLKFGMANAGKQVGVITPVDCKIIKTNWLSG
jgi:DNA polymerase I-like protein with 3'-5' exonuclease and polymerase domains